MHLEMLAHAALHATVAAVIGFFVLFAASKASGIVRLVGTVLGWWLWIIAVLSIVCVFVCPDGKMGDRMSSWMHPAATMAPAAAPADKSAAPAAAPKKP